MIAIENANLVLENGILSDAVLLIDGDRITSLGKKDSIKIPETAERFDANGLYVGPGFVDIHVHGGNGHLFYEAPVEAAEHFLTHGETTVLATLYYDLTKEQFLESINRVKAAMKQDGAGRAIGGFYMKALT